jgi:hypothetical protein
LCALSLVCVPATTERQTASIDARAGQPSLSRSTRPFWLRPSDHGPPRTGYGASGYRGGRQACHPSARTRRKQQVSSDSQATEDRLPTGKSQLAGAGETSLQAVGPSALASSCSELRGESCLPPLLEERRGRASRARREAVRPSWRTFRALGRPASLRLTLDYGLTAARAQTQLIANAIGDKKCSALLQCIEFTGLPRKRYSLVRKGSVKSLSHRQVH